MDTKEKIVLIVEDQPVNRAIAKKILGQEFGVLEASNGIEAIEQLKLHPEITVVLLDLIMPKMNGYQFLEYLQEHKYVSLPVVVMTGDTADSSEQRALEEGAWDYVTKPLKPQILLTRIRNAIARSEVAALEKLHHTMEYDALTDLYNRRRMFEETRRMLDEHPETLFVFLRLDIDRFRLYNSAFGEEEGDRLLLKIAAGIRRTAKRFDVCTYGRMDSDVFCICEPYHPETLQEQMKNVVKDLKAFRSDYFLEPTFGAYVIDERTISIEEMYYRASMGSKKCKNRYAVYLGYYDEQQKNAVQREISIINDMQEALKDHQFELYFQPKFRLDDDMPGGAEALVRWHHPQKGMIPPDEFIPVFEKNGFISKLDYYIWEQVCIVLQRWIQTGVVPYAVSTNVSRMSLYNPCLTQLLTGLCAKYEVPVSLLNLEITESAYMTNPELMRSTIRDLKNAGFCIMMDDFGKGYSSLNTLKDIDVDILKVDMDFLPKDMRVQKGEVILSAVVRMASRLGMTVVVEGIENEKQKNFLAAIGCDYIQGYYFSCPLPLKEYEAKYLKYQKPEQSVPVPPKEALIPEHDSVILIISTDEACRKLFVNHFYGKYYVELCDSVENGMGFLRKNADRVRLVLVDNDLDGLNGLDLLEYYRDDAKISGIPKILILDRNAVEDQVKAFHLGAYECIGKPLVREAVISRVSHVIDLSHQMKNYAKREVTYKKLADRDKMTGLMNKTACQETCAQMLQEQPGALHALMVLDIDYFKQINDLNGHLNGDAVIHCVAGEIKQMFRSTDVIGRFGGDEFVIMMTDIQKYEIAKSKANDFIKTMTIHCAQKLHIKASCSIGITFREYGDTFEEMFRRADQALYEAKNNGRGRVVIYGESVPPIRDDDKPIVLICGEDPQLYPAVALAYGDSAAFCNITSFNDLVNAFRKYPGRIQTICIDMQKKIMQDSDRFYEYILAQGGNTSIPLLAVCQEGDLDQMREALQLQITDIFTLPPQVDVIRKKISQALLLGGAFRHAGTVWPEMEA